MGGRGAAQSCVRQVRIHKQCNMGSEEWRDAAHFPRVQKVPSEALNLSRCVCCCQATDEAERWAGPSAGWGGGEEESEPGRTGQGTAGSATRKVNNETGAINYGGGARPPAVPAGTQRGGGGRIAERSSVAQKRR